MNHKEKPILFSAPMVRAILDGHKTQTRRIIKKPLTENMGNLLRLLKPCRRKKYEYMGDGVKNEVDLKPFAFPDDILWVRETWADVNTPDGPAICYKADGDYQSWHDFSRTFGPDYGEGPSMDYESYPCDYSMWWEDLLNRDEHKEDGYKWRSPIHMFRWASRIDLKVNLIHVERLHDISELDARAEGIIDGGCLNCGESEPCGCKSPQPDARDAFCYLWEQINGKNSWLDNPWVWVIEFDLCV